MEIKYLLISLLLLGCSGRNRLDKNDSCPVRPIIQLEKTDSTDRPTADLNLKSFVVYFLNDFNDSIKGYVNTKLYFNDYVQTNKTSGSSEKYFGYDYSKDTLSATVLKVVGQKSCFEVEVDRRYKLIYVFKNQDQEWTVRFSNVYYINE